MTPDERNLLSQFLAGLGSAKAATKDAEADDMIRQALSTNADAPYLLVQHAILADQSLHAARAHIDELERQVRETAAQSEAPGFLPPAGSPWGQPTQQSPGRMQDIGQAGTPQQTAFSPGSGGLGSFLRNAGATAAGVAGGEMLFSGLSDLFGSRRGGETPAADQGDETIINNYDNSSVDDQINGDDFDDQDSS